MNTFMTEELLKAAPYDFGEQDKEQGSLFYGSLMEELCWHYDNNEKYRRFCERKGFDPHGFTGALSEIPPVQVSVFKELGRELNSVPQPDIRLTLQSSATSGIPSSIPVDRITSRRQAKSMVHIIGDFIGNERKPFLVMDVDPSSGFRSLLGARYAAVSGYLNFASKAEYFLKVGENGLYYFDVDAITDYISKLGNDGPVVVFGYTYLLYSEVVKPMTEKGLRFPLPEGSKVIHIGGWKKLESEKLSREEFDRKTSHIFGIRPENVIDIYGFTEQMGLNYPTCPCGCKHAPLYSEVIVRDPVTKEVVRDGQTGVLEFVTPVPHSYPGNAVLTDDLGVIERGECRCGRAGTRFKIIGRLKKAEIRGCGDILSEKLKFGGGSVQPEKGQEAAETSKYRVEYFHDESLLAGLGPEDSLDRIMDSLEGKLDWIRSQPVDALIGLVAQTAKKWSADGSGAGSALRMNGLGFLSSWCSAEHLTAVMTEGLNGNRMYMDGFIPVSDESAQYRRAVSRGLACHWLAGNVQVLGMFALVESILTKNVNLLKLSSRDGGVFRFLLKAFEGEVYTTPGGWSISGDDLLETIAVVYYGHAEKELGIRMSKRAAIRIAWGGAESVTAVANYLSRYDCEDIILGPKLSFSVVSREALGDEHKARKLGRRIGIDASVFDQEGCSSAHNVFVEEGGAVSPEEFAVYLADGMKKAAVQIPKGPSTVEQVSAVHSARGVYDFKGVVYSDPETVWTVIYDPENEICRPVYSRVVFVHPVRDIMDAVEYVNEDIQTIGLAAEGEKALRFADAASAKGAVRFPACGKMLNFDSPWDGIYLTDRMVKWITIGGPMV